MDPYVLIIHEVDDYDAWKQVFDDAADIRRAAGEISYQLLRDQTSDHNLVHFSSWTSLEAARAFFESPELVEIRKALSFSGILRTACASANIPVSGLC